MKRPPETLLDVHRLSIAFEADGERHTAVDDVSFSLSRGECLGIVGESGCGKSVTALSLARLLPQPMGRILQGEVLFDGRDVLKMNARELQHLRGGRMGFIFQEPMQALNPVRTIGDQIAETLMLHSDMSATTAWTETLRLLNVVHMPDPEQRINDYPHSLSGGMRQRVVIAMALACRPDLIIADEPTTALDVTVQQQILSLIRELRETLHAGVLLITHDLGVIAQNCDRVVVMYAGRIVEEAEVCELFAAPCHAYTKALLAATPRLDLPPKSALPTIPGTVPALSELVQGCRFCQRTGVPAEELVQRPPLIEISPGHWVEACPRCSPEVWAQL
ncbi:MAG TPA: ABC transporter ATP-binding protein [Candidatus Akkermansia intestinigallinarum]|uniref:ABC transporter ATP-binding protein n=1 Tax=Candidatus Akkermansia intestinigallinarum TaxID=2838431 RepID=A0A9D2AHF3_9BACT|nr:ABC transporter ATP-binding protein [Candidatus Akkermansia intestinigallinarum]